MAGLGWSWSAFLVYVFGLVFMVLGGLYGLYESGHPAFLAPILMGLFFFYLTWEAVVDEEDFAPPSKPGKQL